MKVSSSRVAARWLAAMACGDCYRWASKAGLAAFGDDRLVVIHAEVRPEWGLTADGQVYENRKRFGHAWVEENGKVMDWQTEQGMAVGPDGTPWPKGKPWPKQLYYETMRPRDIQTYTAKQAALMPVRAHNYGPWTPAERRKHSDLFE